MEIPERWKRGFSRKKAQKTQKPLREWALGPAEGVRIIERRIMEKEKVSDL